MKKPEELYITQFILKILYPTLSPGLFNEPSFLPVNDDDI